MRKYKIGTKHFEGTVDITDPCYSKGVWCRMTAEVKAGEYDCRIWRHTTKGVYNRREYNDVRVGKIGIYHNGIVPNVKLMQLIGSIGVDAGLAGFFMNKPDYNDEEWEELCLSIRGGDAWIRDDGFFSHSGYGDGCYGVYAYKRDNEIVALEIRFL
jgi:hypothetical protein